MLQRESHHLRQRIQDLERQLSRSAERIRQLEDAGQPEALHESEERLALAMNAAQFWRLRFLSTQRKADPVDRRQQSFRIIARGGAFLRGFAERDSSGRPSARRPPPSASDAPGEGGRYAAEYRIVGVEGQLERWAWLPGSTFCWRSAIRGSA